MAKQEKEHRNPNQKENLSVVEKRLAFQLTINDQLMNDIHDGVIIADVAGKIQKANAAALALLQVTDEELKNETIEQFFKTKESDREKAEKSSVEENVRKRFGIAETKYVLFRRKNGSTVPVEFSTSLLHDAEGFLNGILVVFYDLSTRVSAEEQLLNQVSYDHLTGVPNRFIFEATLSHILNTSKRLNQQVTVLCINLDNFQKVNDLFGYQIGDEILIRVASRIKNITKKSDMVARSTGDEFLVIQEGGMELRDTLNVVENILEQIKKPLVFSNNKKEVSITATIGIAISSLEDNTTSEALIANSRVAMQSAKQSGGDCYKFHSDSLHKQNLLQLQLEYELNRAFKNNEFLLHFQPIYSTEKKLKEFEVLLRWKDPEKGVIPAYKFIETLEKMNLMSDIDRWVIDRTLAQYRKWLDNGLISEDVSMAINISARDFGKHDIVNYIKNAIKKYSISPKCIIIEVTESTVMMDVDLAVLFLKELDSLGLKVCIDDFGKGHSSLAYLKKFPVKIIKIDGLFIKEMISSAGDLSIVKAIILLANVFQLSVIAECVETKEQLDMLHKMGCQEVQGWYFGGDLHPEAAERLLKELKGRE